jgi:AcrR family transcriptional regulator
MSNDNVREQLIKVTIRLLTESRSPGKITARQIAAEAKVNLALINYYFHSKNELLNIAVSIILENKAEKLMEIYSMDIPAKQKLIKFLTTIVEIIMEYTDILKPHISYILLEGDMSTSLQILPIIKEHYTDKSEAECRIIAYQLISFLQLIFYRSTEFFKYSGIDIMNREERDKLLQLIIDNTIK